MTNKKPDVYWWEFIPVALAVLFIAAVCLYGCASPAALQENRHKNDQKYWSELTDIIDQSNEESGH